MKKEEDRISELPEFIIDNILSRLDSSKQRVRVSVLSKKWRALTTCFPYLYFHFDEFFECVYKRYDHIDARFLFFKYVEHSVSRFFRQQNLKNVHAFKLFTLFPNKKEVVIIKKCLKLILQKGVKVLDIHIEKNFENPKIVCLPVIPSSSPAVSSLTFLKISNLLPLSLTNAALKCLKVLYFRWVSLDPHAIEQLTVSCRLLEELTFVHCSGLKKFYVGHFQNLKKLRFQDYDGVEEIDIKAPNLCVCYLYVEYVQGKGAPSMNLGSCQRLRTLHLAGSPFLTSKGISDFLSSFLNKSNFRFLENLSLCLRNQGKKIVLDTARTQPQPYELVQFRLELETIKDISVVDDVLLFCRPRSLSVISNFYSIDYKEKGRVVKHIQDKLLEQEHQGLYSIRIEWFDAKFRSIYYIPTKFSDHQLRETVTFIKQVVQEEENKETIHG